MLIWIKTSKQGKGACRAPLFLNELDLLLDLSANKHCRAAHTWGAALD
jgi:hypothetical protein